MKSSKILVTGGAGYIGSHTVVKLLEMNKSVLILDNFSNINYGVINRIKKIRNGDLKVIKGDVTNRNLIKKIFNDFKVENVIHFAGLKAVRESEIFPIKYYKNNVLGSLILFEEMENAGVRNIVFSSSASVYGDQPIKKYKEGSLGYCCKSSSIPFNAAKLRPESAKIKKGDTLCIVEAMKVMNEIQSDISGEILEIIPEDGDSVEFGQALFKIRTV